MLLVKLPVPVASDVWLSLTIGLADVLQQMPLAVTEAPPSFVTFPPLEALVEVIEDADVVVTVGAAVSLSSFVTKASISPALAP